MHDSEAVKLWRDRFRLNLSASWKADVEKTVTDLKLWKTILDGWHYFKDGKKVTKHPGIKNLLTEYERRQLESEEKDANRQREAEAEHYRKGLSERGVSPMFQLRVRASGWKG